MTATNIFYNFVGFRYSPPIRIVVDMNWLELYVYVSVEIYMPNMCMSKQV